MAVESPHSWFRFLPRALRAQLLARPDMAAVVGNIGWLFADKLLRLVIAIVVGVWLARYLGPGRFGELSYALAVVALMGAVAGMGLNGIAVRDLVRLPNQTGSILGAAFGLQVIAGTAAFVGVLALAPWLRTNGAESQAVLIVLGGTLLFKSSEVAKYWFDATLQSRYGVWVENAALLMGAGARLGLIFGGASLLAFAWVGVLEAAVMACGLLLVLRILKVRMALRSAASAQAGTMLRESWPLLLSALTVILYMRLDMLMLDKMVGSHETGIYAAATRISEVLYLIPSVVVSSLTPAIMRAYRDQPEVYLERMKRLYALLAWIAVVTTFPLAFLAGPLVRMAFGAEYQSAGPVLAVHLWASIPVFLGVASSQHLLADGKQMLSFWRTLIGLLCNVVLNLLLIPDLKALGAAVATVISYFVATYSLLLFRTTYQHALHMVAAPFSIPLRLLKQQ